MSYIVPNHYPTICGYCGSPLVKGEDGEMHCSLMCPHWQHSVELGFNDPAALRTITTATYIFSHDNL